MGSPIIPPPPYPPGGGGGGYVDPLTTNGDMVVRAAGVTTRLPVGSDGQALTVVSGAPTWTNGFTNPMTTAGDLIIGGVSGAPSRLAAGSYNAWQTLGISSAGAPEWVDLPGAVVGWIHDGTTAHGILGTTFTTSGSASSNVNQADGPEHRRGSSGTSQMVTATTFGFKPRFRGVVAFVIRNAFPTGSGGFALGFGASSLTSLLATDRIQIVSDNTTYGDTNYRAYVRGSGSATATDLGFAPVLDQFVEAAFTFFSGGVRIRCTGTDGAVLGDATISTNTPAPNTLLAMNLLSIGGGVNSPQLCVVRGRSRVELIR
jgi:hypothetical protein